MSYSHTKRRKLIASLKRKNPRNWRSQLVGIGEAKRKEMDGPCTGTLADLIPPGPYGEAQLVSDIQAAERACEEEAHFD